jgi:nitrite reductase (NADH) small subunit
MVKIYLLLYTLQIKSIYFFGNLNNNYNIIKILKMKRVRVAHRGEIKDRSGKEISVDDTKIALFHANGKYYAIEALCRHQDGSLAPGKIDGEVVECPLHAWHYNIKTGELVDYLSDVKLTTYEVEVEGNDIFINI